MLLIYSALLFYCHHYKLSSVNVLFELNKPYGCMFIQTLPNNCNLYWLNKLNCSKLSINSIVQIAKSTLRIYIEIQPKYIAYLGLSVYIHIGAYRYTNVDLYSGGSRGLWGLNPPPPHPPKLTPELSQIYCPCIILKIPCRPTGLVKTLVKIHLAPPPPPPPHCKILDPPLIHVCII